MKKNFIFYFFLLALSFSPTQLFVSCTLKTSSTDLREKNEEFDDPSAAAEWEFNMLKDRSGKIPAHIREQEVAQARSIYAKQSRNSRIKSNQYSLQGPLNIGGRSRCVVYDVRYNGSSNRTIIAGGVTGGVYKSTDDGASWIRKSPTSAIYSVTTLAQDPRPGHQDTWYYGTGEFLGSNEHHSAPYQSDGVFKSTNNGETWAKLPNSNTGVFEQFDRREDVIWRVLVNPANGDVYMAAAGAIYKSSNGGETWESVLSAEGSGINPFQSTDIIITGSGKLYAAFAGYCPGAVDGVWTSLSGNTGSWIRIAGEGAGGSPAGWYTEDMYGRIVLASAASNPNLVYAFVQSFANLCEPNLSRARLFKWDNSAGNWTNLSNNLPDCSGGAAMDMQGGYNMMIHVKPDNANVVFIGAQNLYRSTDGFTTGIHVTQIGGYNNWNLHPDMHWIAFRPGNPNTMIVADDGGLQRTTDNLAATVVWSSLNNNFVTTQFYYVAIDPLKGSDKIIGGTQDNGTLGNVNETGTYFNMISGGDGISVGYSKEINGKVYQYTSYQAAVINRFNAEIGTIGITPFNVSGSTSFYTLFKLDDDNTEYLYFARNNHLWRTTAASTVTGQNWTEMTGIASLTHPTGNVAWWTALAASRGNYDPAKSSLFLGNDFGQIFRLDNPAFANPATLPVNITGPGFEDWGNISSIAVNPRNDDTILVTRSNYGGLSIWWTGNASSSHPTWVNVERNLTLPSIRSSTIAVTADGVEYFVGTSVGLFHSSNPVTTNWNQESAEGIGNAVVTSIALRPSDNRLIAGTYGNGIWATSLSSTPLPVTLLNFTGKLQNDYVVLDWYTNTEYNSDRFEIQRAYDGTDFAKIGSVAAIKSSNTVYHYEFVDPDAISSDCYYRLKMIDQDGQYEFSKVVLIKPDKTLQSITVINPFEDQIKMKLAKAPQDRVEVRLFDLSGKLIGKEEFRSREATLRFGNKLASLGKAVYMLEIKTGNEIFRLRVLKQ